MTLEEYREQEKKNRRQAEFKIRRAGEGVDGDQWKKTYVLKKEKQEGEEEEEYDEEVRVCSPGLRLFCVAPGLPALPFRRGGPERGRLVWFSVCSRGLRLFCATPCSLALHASSYPVYIIHRCVVLQH